METEKSKVWDEHMKVQKKKMNQDHPLVYDPTNTVAVPTHYGQIVATICQVMWTQNSEDAIHEQANNPFAL